MPDKQKTNLKTAKNSENAESPSFASIAFMVFGFGLVFFSLFLFHKQQNQTSFSSVRPLRITSQIDPETSFDRKRKVEGLEINNQRISAEIKKEQEMISLSGKYLGPKDIPDRLLKGVDLSSEANTQLQIHDRLKDDRNSYPDVYIPRELAVDHAIYEQALREEQQDRAIFLERLKKRTAALNLEIQYDSKTGEVTIDRSPQSEDTQATGGASR